MNKTQFFFQKPYSANVGGLAGTIDCNDFGMVLAECEWPSSIKVKDVGAVDVPGETGERTFFPDRAPLEPFDFKATFYLRIDDEDLYAAYEAFCDYLTGRDASTGTELSVYIPAERIGWRKIRVTAISEKDHWVDPDGGESFLSIEVTFRVTDPDAKAVMVNGAIIAKI